MNKWWESLAEINVRRDVKAQLKHKIILSNVNEILEDLLYPQYRMLKIFQKLE